MSDERREVLEWRARHFLKNEDGFLGSTYQILAAFAEAEVTRALAEKDAHEKEHIEDLSLDVSAAHSATNRVQNEVYRLQAKLAEAERERDEARGYEAQKEAWDVRGFFDALKDSGLEAITHEDGWALTTPTVLDDMRARISALEADLAAMRGALQQLVIKVRQIEPYAHDAILFKANHGFKYVGPTWREEIETAITALASSPGAALETMREVVLALERVLVTIDACEKLTDHPHKMWDEARALLARPEVKRWAGR
ncbi:MAG TPA: hypothetical protein VGV13_13690 [Methylomirabilota bacterium]|jgi:hypothetical protein|nr:hypothetical protein [Methylomirabilota bacterium]